MHKKPVYRRWTFWIVALAVAVMAAVAGAVLWNRSTSAEFSRTLTPAAPAPPDDPDARLRGLVLGAWADEYEGKRTMTLNADGTGTMIVELSGWRAALAAPRLTFNMKWSLEAGRLKKQTISGEPEGKVKMILSMMGDHVDEPILDLNEQHLLLLDKDGKTKYDWKRVKK